MRRLLTVVVIGAFALMGACAGCKKGDAGASSDPNAGPAAVKAKMAAGGGTAPGKAPAGAPAPKTPAPDAK
jgi:hypothetical protein